jgi:dihydrofolate reductase
MRQIRYSVAMSLDGFIADPQGGFDWIPQDPEIDFAALFRRYDTVLMGRRSFEAARATGGALPELRTVVASRTLRPEDHPGVTVVGDNLAGEVGRLRAVPGKDIWLFGGGELFRSLLAAGLVDGVEVAVLPILLGAGIPMLPAPAPRVRLALVDRKVYQSGIVWLDYRVDYGAA